MLFLIAMEAGLTGTACTVVGALLHYWLLVTFCWMLVEGFHIYHTFVTVFETRDTNRVNKYCGLAYGIPVIIVVVSAAGWPDDYSSDGVCWLSSGSGTNNLIWAFVGPVGFIVAVNCVVFAIVFKKILQVRWPSTPSARVILPAGFTTSMACRWTCGPYRGPKAQPDGQEKRKKKRGKKRRKKEGLRGSHPLWRCRTIPPASQAKVSSSSASRGRLSIAKAKAKRSVKASLSFLTLLGVTWVFGFLMMLEPSAVGLQYAFSFCNAFLGVWVRIAPAAPPPRRPASSEQLALTGATVRIVRWSKVMSSARSGKKKKKKVPGRVGMHRQPLAVNGVSTC